jgi:tetratricopeptide (TPR) repeat protein
MEHMSQSANESRSEQTAGFSRRRLLRFIAYLCSPLPSLAISDRALGRPQETHSFAEPALPLEYQSTTKIRYTTDVGGFFKAIQLFRRFHRAGDEQDLRANCERRRQALETEISFLRDYIAKAGTALSGMTLAHAHEAHAQFLSYLGQYRPAIQEFQAAYDLAAANSASAAELLRLRESLGIAELRRGESENCINGHVAMSCIYPIHTGAHHMLPSGSQRAIEHFLAYLETAPDDMEVKWLLNVACMTVGDYPAGFPSRHRFQPEQARAEGNIGHFVDIAPALGLNNFQMAGGVIVDDFDEDGYLDILSSTFDSCASLRYFHNNGDGTFSDWTRKAGLSEQLGGLNMIQGDFNNDGRLDVFVMRGAWELPIRNSLLRNNGDGTFTDVTQQAGLAIPACQTLSAAWGDFDNDGHLDLFVGNENAPNQLFHNNGGGTFVDVGRASGIDHIACAKGVAVGDYDGDGYLDIYVSNLGSDNLLFRNNRNGTFTNVARGAGVSAPTWSFPTWFFDYDNDGKLDLFVASYSFSLVDVLNSWTRRPAASETMKLYRNCGDGSFHDVSSQVGLDRVLMPMGSNFGELTNDGYLDMYLGTGGPSYGSLVPNVLLKNDRGSRFVDVTTASGTGHLQKGHAVAFADINNDGDQEILAQIGGATPGDRFFSAVFRNPGGHGNNWINIRLVGVKSNRSAIGARLKLTIQEPGSPARTIFRWVTSGGSFGSSPLRQHIGIGKAKDIDELEIWWPTSKTRQVFHKIASNRFLQITEFERHYTTCDNKTFALPSQNGLT